MVSSATFCRQGERVSSSLEAQSLVGKHKDVHSSLPKLPFYSPAPATMQLPSQLPRAVQVSRRLLLLCLFQHRMPPLQRYSEQSCAKRLVRLVEREGGQRTARGGRAAERGASVAAVLRRRGDEGLLEWERAKVAARVSEVHCPFKSGRQKGAEPRETKSKARENCCGGERR